MSGIEKAIKAAGSLTELANRVGVTVGAVWQWKRARRIPIERVFDVERVTGVPRSVLRPDFFAGPQVPPPDRVSHD